MVSKICQIQGTANDIPFILPLGNFPPRSMTFVADAERPCFVLVIDRHAKVSIECSDKLCAKRNLVLVLLGTYVVFTYVTKRIW